ncbi:MAG: MlaD family protein [Planctomycetota bacterium]
MSSKRHTILGLLFLAAVGLLGYYTLFRADFNPFTEQHFMTVYFEDGGGLREGDAILVAGMRWGKVDKLQYDAREEDLERRVRADLMLNQKVLLYKDHSITIEDASILGGKVLRIEPGSPTSGDQPAGDLYGSVPGNPLSQVGKLIEENRGALHSTLTDLSGLMADARAGKGVMGALFTDEGMRKDLGEAVASIREAFNKVDELVATISGGTGTISKFINDDALYNEIESLAKRLTEGVSETREILAQVRSGKGTVGTLLYDDVAAERLRTTMDDISAVASRLRLGEGTLGRLLTDSTFADKAKELMLAITEGDGTVHRLIYDGNLYNSALAVVEDLKDFTTTLGNNNGTIAKLFASDEVYRELLLALRTLTGSLEEAREAAPISAFLSLAFQGF